MRVRNDNWNFRKNLQEAETIRRNEVKRRDRWNITQQYTIDGWLDSGFLYLRWETSVKVVNIRLGWSYNA